MLLKRFIFTLFFVVLGTSAANAIETQAKYAILMDFDTGDCIFEKDAQKMVPPASMSKLMTLYVVMDKLKKGELSLDDTFTVSENAWRKGGAATGGSTMFLSINDKVKIEDLLRGIIIQSGNDACIVVAENISGSEEKFAEHMMETAKELGLENSSFVNSTGLPHPDQRMSMEDLAKLAQILIREFPEYYHIFSERSFTYNNIKQGNRNPLLYSMSNADGLKTGHTEEAGFGLVSSATKDDRRLIGVISGLKSSKERSEEADKIMSWGFREFDNYQVAKKGNKIKDVPVWLGQESFVGLVVAEDIFVTVKKSDAKKIKVVAQYNSPVKAPVSKGDVLGVLRIEIPERDTIVVDIIADRDIVKKNLFSRIIANIKYIIFGVY